MSLRLMLIAEGSTEYGHSPGTQPIQPGAAVMDVLVRTVAEQISTDVGGVARSFQFVQTRSVRELKFNKKELARVVEGKLTLSSPAWRGKLIAAMQLTSTLGLDGIVICQDREGYERTDLDVYSIFDDLTQNGAIGRFANKVIIISNPCRCIETWLLCDMSAVQAVLKVVGESPFTGNPEERPSPDTLKLWLRDKASAVFLSVADARLQLARAIRRQHAAQRCAKSFSRFCSMIEGQLIARGTAAGAGQIK